MGVNILLKLLIAGDKTRFIHLKKFSLELEKIGIESKLIHDIEFFDKFFEGNVKKKLERDRNFKKILKDVEPDAVLLDRISGLATKITKANIPLLILCRGNYWEELSWAKKTIYKSRIKGMAASYKSKQLIDFCLKKSSVILPISRYLENEVKKRYPKKNVELFPADGRDPLEWNQTSGMNLKHPCVGLLQGMNIWGKTRELLTLTKVMKKLPNVTFYFAGDGLYRDKIIPKLKKFENFVWLESLEYPLEVKKFLSEIDIYLLLSGLEGLGQTIIEALLMEKPVIATNIGGIPELIEDGKTGFLIESGDHEDLIKKIKQVFGQPIIAGNMGSKGKEIMQENFSWSNIAKKFALILNQNI